MRILKLAGLRCFHASYRRLEQTSPSAPASCDAALLANTDVTLLLQRKTPLRRDNP